MAELIPVNRPDQADARAKRVAENRPCESEVPPPPVTPHGEEELNDWLHAREIPELAAWFSEETLAQEHRATP